MSDLNKYLKLILSDLTKFNEIADRGVLILMLDDYKRKLQHISNEFKLSSADMKIVQQISIEIKTLEETLSNKNIIKE